MGKSNTIWTHLNASCCDGDLASNLLLPYSVARFVPQKLPVHLLSSASHTLGMYRGGDAHEELRGLKSLPLSELLVRLIFLYRHLQENPVSDLLDASEIVGEVTTDQVETLCHYLYLADQAYDCGTEDNLKTVLEEEGTLLVSDCTRTKTNTVNP